VSNGEAAPRTACLDVVKGIADTLRALLAVLPSRVQNGALVARQVGPQTSPRGPPKHTPGRVQANRHFHAYAWIKFISTRIRQDSLNVRHLLDAYASRSLCVTGAERFTDAYARVDRS
jgi:hypothetical protein